MAPIDYSVEMAWWAAATNLVLQYGDRKHGPADWQDVSRDKWLAALLRHVGAHERGDFFDPETGLPHIAHAMANLVMLARTKVKV